MVRVSGEQAITIVGSLFRGRTDLREAKANTAHYGEIIRGGEVLDEVVATVFRAPHSFTGEDTVEISCHGSMYIQQELLRWLVDAGCRLAKAGEFTQRAFLNGKLDLAEAEAVADLIASQSKAEKDLALKQLKGSVSDEIAVLRDRLLRFTSLIELELDFADHEELEFADRTELKTLAEEIHCRLNGLTHSFQAGNAIKKGIAVALIGETNVGKSTLLNALVGEERAIVSDIAGTTRDTIEDTLVIDGILFRLIDTAGVRETEDRLENMGIERSRRAARNAQIVISMSDADNNEPILDFPISATILNVLNKCDLRHGKTGNGKICISAKNGDIEPLKKELVRVARESMQTCAVMLSNARHYEALSRAYDAIKRVREGMANELSGELLSVDLQDCLSALGEVTGQITNTEVLQNIFSKFCIGK